MDSRARPNERTDLFPYGCGGRLSSDSVQYLVSKYVVVVQEKCTAQTRNAARTRRNAAIELLQAGVDRAVIARWLGHESLEPHKSISTPILRSKSKHFRRHGHRGRSTDS